jgi:hypothetical protein
VVRGIGFAHFIELRENLIRATGGKIDLLASDKMKVVSEGALPAGSREAAVHLGTRHGGIHRLGDERQVAVMIAAGDKNGDQKLSSQETTSLADGWYDRLDPDKTGKVSRADFMARFRKDPTSRRAPGPISTTSSPVSSNSTGSIRRKSR